MNLRNKMFQQFQLAENENGKIKTILVHDLFYDGKMKQKMNCSKYDSNKKK